MIKIPATIEGISTRTDKTLKITIATQEMDAESAAELMALHQKFGWLVFSENMVSESEVPAEPAPEFKGDKTPSKRLRAVLFKHWQMNTSKQEDFDSYYKRTVERFIETIKEKLN